MSRVYNFSAGPAMLPEAVLQRAKEDLPEWGDSGMSVMEMSHRGKDYMSIAEQAEADLRELMAIPDNYKVLFMQGGASSQFTMIPMNLAANGGKADYINTGSWSKKAITEGKRFCDVNIAGASDEGKFNAPSQDQLNLTADASYLHYTPNETIQGIEFSYVPKNGDVPVIADMSSTILSRPVNVSDFGMIYAGAQKNAGIAGMAIVIIREDLIGNAGENTPAMFDYKVAADNGSMYNTPPAYAWYVSGLIFQWLKELGGLDAMAAINERKAKKLYAAIDGSSFFNNPVELDCRSWMNVPFTLANADLDGTFLEEASAVGLKTLKGHRSVGGMRASIYNAMPEAGVDALVDFMAEFERKHG